MPEKGFYLRIKFYTVKERFDGIFYFAPGETFRFVKAKSLSLSDELTKVLDERGALPLSIWTDRKIFRLNNGKPHDVNDNGVCVWEIRPTTFRACTCRAGGH